MVTLLDLVSVYHASLSYFSKMCTLFLQIVYSLFFFSLHYRGKKMQSQFAIFLLLKMTENSNQQRFLCRMVESVQWTSIEHQISW